MKPLAAVLLRRSGLAVTLVARQARKFTPMGILLRYGICVPKLSQSGGGSRQDAGRETVRLGKGIESWGDGGTAMTRYGFNIRTRSGQRVDNICIMAATQIDAERRLRQMYHHCEIIACQSEAVALRNDPLDVEAVIGIISDEPELIPSVARSMLRNKAGTH